jgi:hypothetical protein
MAKGEDKKQDKENSLEKKREKSTYIITTWRCFCIYTAQFLPNNHSVESLFTFHVCKQRKGKQIQCII